MIKSSRQINFFLLYADDACREKKKITFLYYILIRSTIATIVIIAVRMYRPR